MYYPLYYHCISNSLIPSLTKINQKKKLKKKLKKKKKKHQVITLLKEPSPSLALRLFLQSAQVACKVGFGVIANDFFCEALLLYEVKLLFIIIIIYGGGIMLLTMKLPVKLVLV